MDERVIPLREWFELDDEMIEDKAKGVWYLLGMRCKQYKTRTMRKHECVEIAGATEDERHRKLVEFVDQPTVHKPASVVEALRAALGRE